MDLNFIFVVKSHSKTAWDTVGSKCAFGTCTNVAAPSPFFLAVVLGCISDDVKVFELSFIHLYHSVHPDLDRGITQDCSDRQRNHLSLTMPMITVFALSIATTYGL